jgi:hypothetical protein
MERTEVLSAEASSNTDRAKRRGLGQAIYLDVRRAAGATSRRDSPAVACRST